MNWSDKWQKLVLGSSLREGGDPFTSSEFVEWYDLQLEYNNYPGILLEKIQSHLNKHSTVLEIGAGTGAFTIPLARQVKEVTVVEPSAEMCKYLRSKAEGLANICIVNKRWEDVDFEKIGWHDMALGAHSLYSIVDIDTALKKMASAAKRQLCFIIGASPVSFYEDTWQRFKENKYRPSPSFIHLYHVLYQLGLFANVEMVQTARNQVYLNLEQAVKRWQSRLHLGPEMEDELRVYLMSCLKEKKGPLYRKEEGKSAVISVELLA